MKKTTVAIGLLTVLLIGSNMWWAFKVLDGGVTHTYLRASHDSATELVGQLRAVLGALTKGTSSQSDVLAAVQSATPGAQPHEKLGYTWVGQLGLKFNEQGRLSHVVTSEEEAR